MPFDSTVLTEYYTVLLQFRRTVRTTGTRVHLLKLPCQALKCNHDLLYRQGTNKT